MSARGASSIAYHSYCISIVDRFLNAMVVEEGFKGQLSKMQLKASPHSTCRKKPMEMKGTLGIFRLIYQLCSHFDDYCKWLITG